MINNLYFQLLVATFAPGHLAGRVLTAYAHAQSICLLLTSSAGPGASFLMSSVLYGV